MNNSPARCGAPPVPAEQKLTSPGRAFACAIRSFDGLGGDVRVDGHDQRKLCYQDYGRKVFDRIVRQVCVDVRPDAVGGDRVQKQRVAIRVRFGDRGGRGRATGAPAINDDDRLPERVCELRPDEPANKIGGAARRNSDNKLDRTVRVVSLRPRHARQSADNSRDNE